MIIFSLNHISESFGKSWDEWDLAEMDVCFPLHFFPRHCSFPCRLGTGLPSKSEGWVRLHAWLQFCAASWKQVLSYAAQFWAVFGFFSFLFSLICPPDPELKPSIHFTWSSDSWLKSAIVSSANTRFQPTESVVLAPPGLKVPVLWCVRGFLFRKQSEKLP